MHDDVVGAGRLSVVGEVQDGVEFLVRTGDHYPALVSRFVGGDFEDEFSFHERKGEEFSLLPGNEHTADSGVVDPVAQIAAEARFVKRQVRGEWREIGDPQPLHVG